MSTNQTLPPGTKVGPYVIQEFRAKGGMGMVYRASHAGLKRDVALKILYPHLIGDGDFAQRFQREGQMMASLRHENIVEVYDAGEADGMLYIAMEWVPGGNAQQLLKSLHDAGKRMPVAQALQIARQIASALDYAHSKGIVHRDLKPSNIMIGGTDRYVLGDFGIALDSTATKLTSGMTSMGTVEYMSPEQGQGLPVDGRSDIYSLGCVLYELLTGRVPFGATNPLALLNKHIKEPLPPLRRARPDAPQVAQDMVEKATAKKPSDRYPSASAFVAALDDALAGRAKRAVNVGALLPLGLGALVLGGLGVAAVSLLNPAPAAPAATLTPPPPLAPTQTASAPPPTTAPKTPTPAAPATSVITQVIVVVTATPLPATDTPVATTPAPATATSTGLPRTPTPTRNAQTATPTRSPTPAPSATAAGLQGFSAQIMQNRAGYETWGAPVPQYPCSGDNNRGTGKRFAWTLKVQNNTGQDVSGMAVAATAANGVPLVVCGAIPKVPNGQAPEISLYVLTMTPVWDVRVTLPGGAYTQRFCFDESAAVTSCDGSRPVAQVTPQTRVSIQNNTGDNGPQINMEAFEFQNGEYRKLGNMVRGQSPIEVTRPPGRMSFRVCRNQASDQCFQVDQTFEAGSYAIIVVSYDMRAGQQQKCAYGYRNDSLQACIGVERR